MPKDFVPKKLTQRTQRYKEHKEGAGSNKILSVLCELRASA